MSFSLDPSWHFRPRHPWAPHSRSTYPSLVLHGGGPANRRARLGCAPSRVVLEEAAHFAVARLLVGAGSLPRASGASEPDWVGELFGPPPKWSTWRREATRLVARLRTVRGWKTEPVRSSAAPLARMLELPRERWPDALELVARAMRLGPSQSVRFGAVEAYVRAGRSDLALELCRDGLLATNEPERAWRTWAVLGYLHLDAGDHELAQGAFETAAECDACGMTVLVEALAGSLRESDERAVRVAAARLELLISPDHAGFQRALELVRRRGGLAREQRARWRPLLGSRASAAQAVFTALG